MVVARMLCTVESPLCTRLQQTFDGVQPLMVSICMVEHVANFSMHNVMMII
jgi:hypothetical protein